MITFLRRRSLLPILATLGALAPGLGLSGAAVAADQDFLTLVPVRTSCKLVDVRGGARRCDVVYDGLVVHEGREMNPPVANGDCAKCGSVLDRAQQLGRNVVMLRGYVDGDEADWGLSYFFTVEGDLGAACR